MESEIRTVTHVRAELMANGDVVISGARSREREPSSPGAHFSPSRAVAVRVGG